MTIRFSGASVRGGDNKPERQTCVSIRLLFDGRPLAGGVKKSPRETTWEISIPTDNAELKLLAQSGGSGDLTIDTGGHWRMDSFASSFEALSRSHWRLAQTLSAASGVIEA